MTLINLRRVTECDQCDRLAPVPNNAKRGSERDRAVLCKACEGRFRRLANVQKVCIRCGGEVFVNLLFCTPCADALRRIAYDAAITDEDEVSEETRDEKERLRKEDLRFEPDFGEAN